MTKAEQRKRAVKLTLPVFCGYIVLGIAFGATLAQAGYGPVWRWPSARWFTPEACNS